MLWPGDTVAVGSRKPGRIGPLGAVAPRSRLLIPPLLRGPRAVGIVTARADSLGLANPRCERGLATPACGKVKVFRRISRETNGRVCDWFQCNSPTGNGTTFIFFMPHELRSILRRCRERNGRVFRVSRTTARNDRVIRRTSGKRIHPPSFSITKLRGNTWEIFAETPSVRTRSLGKGERRRRTRVGKPAAIRRFN